MNYLGLNFIPNQLYNRHLHIQSIYIKENKNYRNKIKQRKKFRFSEIN